MSDPPSLFAAAHDAAGANGRRRPRV